MIKNIIWIILDLITGVIVSVLVGFVDMNIFLKIVTIFYISSSTLYCISARLDNISKILKNELDKLRNENEELDDLLARQMLKMDELDKLEPML